MKPRIAKLSTGEWRVTLKGRTGPVAGLGYAPQAALTNAIMAWRAAQTAA